MKTRSALAVRGSVVLCTLGLLAGACAENAKPEAAGGSAADVDVQVADPDAVAQGAEDVAVDEAEAGSNIAAFDADGTVAEDADVPSDVNAPADVAVDVAAPDIVDAGAQVDVAEADGATEPLIDLYDPDYMPQFDLTVDAAAMAVLMDPSVATQKTWVHAAFTSEGVTLADVGLRRKGASTYRVVPKKAAFKVKFDKWVKGQTFHGYTDLTLNNMVDDATGLRERLSYFVYRSLGVPAPKCNTAVVTLNGEPYGPYANIETPDDQLMAALFGAKAKTLYEVNAGSQWLPGSEVGFLLDVGGASMADLLALFTAVATAKDDDLLAGVQAVLDVTEWLRYCGVEAATGQFDHYAYGVFGSHNYFMAGDIDGVFRLLPWSTDLSFSDDKGVLDASKPLPADPVYGGVTLLGRCRLTPMCWDIYRSQVAAVLSDYEKLDLATVAKTWHEQIDAVQTADSKREAPLDYYIASVPELYVWIKTRPAIVKKQLELQ